MFINPGFGCDFAAPFFKNAPVINSLSPKSSQAVKNFRRVVEGCVSKSQIFLFIRIVTKTRINPDACRGFDDDKRNKIQIPDISVNFAGIFLRLRFAKKNNGDIVSALLVSK